MRGITRTPKRQEAAPCPDLDLRPGGDGNSEHHCASPLTNFQTLVTYHAPMTALTATTRTPKAPTSTFSSLGDVRNQVAAPVLLALVLTVILLVVILLVGTPEGMR